MEEVKVIIVDNQETVSLYVSTGEESSSGVISPINGLSLIGGDVGLGGTLIQDTDIDLNNFKSSLSGIGEVDYKINLPSGTIEAGYQASDDVLDLQAMMGLPSGIKGTGIFARDGVVPSSVLCRVFAGDASVFGGMPWQTSIGVSALDGSTGSVDISTQIDNVAGSSTEDYANASINVDAINNGYASVIIDAISQSNGTSRIQLSIGDNSIYHSISLRDNAFYIGSYRLPWTDGTLGQTLVTDGSGNVTWQSGSGSTFYNSDGIITDLIRDIDVNNALLRFKNADVINLQTNNNGYLSLSSVGTTVLKTATNQSMNLDADTGFQLSVNGMGAPLSIDNFDGDINIVTGNNGNLTISDGVAGGGNGSAGQVLGSDGAGNVVWTNASGGGIYSGSGILGADPVVVSGAAITAGLDFNELNRFDVEASTMTFDVSVFTLNSSQRVTINGSENAGIGVQIFAQDGDLEVNAGMGYVKLASFSNSGTSGQVWTVNATGNQEFQDPPITNNLPSYPTTGDAAIDGGLASGVFFKVSNGDGTSAIHIKD